MNKSGGSSLLKRMSGTYAVLLVSAWIFSSMGCGFGQRANAAKEMAAIQSVRTIHNAETQYYAQYSRYASLQELGPPSAGQPGPNAADLIPAALASGNKGGYVFRLSPQAKGYQVTANAEQAGSRSFYSDETMVIRQSSTGEATAQSPELK